MLERVLILGGGGFVSGAFANALINKGYKTWTLSRGYKSIPHGAFPLKANRANKQSMASAIHNAGTEWDFVFDFSGYHSDHVQTSTSILKKYVRHYVFVSSDLVIDHTVRNVPHDEKNEAFAPSGYGYQKRLSELYVMNLESLGVVWTIFRPCHIYGPGSQLGCFPLHLRDPELIYRLQRNQPISLVAAGYYLQQPIFIEDFIDLLLNVLSNTRTQNETYFAAGPTVLCSQDYYRIIATLMGCQIKIESIDQTYFVQRKPEDIQYLCHRVYNLSKLTSHQLPDPQTSIHEGLKLHLRSIFDKD